MMKDVTPLKVGVVGTGNMGRNHLRVLSTMPEYDLVGCFDVSAEAAQQQAALYGIEAFATTDELFAAVDVAHIVVPSSLHKELACAAAAAGCHVLVEKPIALLEEDAQAIIDACNTAGVRLCVGHVERYNPAISTLSDILAGEELISADFRRLSPYTGRIADADVVEDLMIHDLDILNAIAQSQVGYLAAQGAKIYTDRLDYAQAIITFESGFMACLTASRVTESKIRDAIINAKDALIRVDYLNRTVEVSRKTNITLDVGHPLEYSQESVVEKVFVPMVEPLRSEFEHFAHCISTGEPVATSGEMAKQALVLCRRIAAEASK